MAGHTLTPYNIVATRKRARKDKDVELLLANIGKAEPVDLLDALADHLVEARRCRARMSRDG